MAYDTLASSRSPALIVYVLDVSASMGRPLGDRRRIDVVTEALGAALRQMAFRSTKGVRVAPRYRVAMFAYSDHVYDLLDGIKPIDQVVRLGVPPLMPRQGTDTARAFAQVERLLERELGDLARCPAPLVCHMTDSEYTGADPEPVARRLMALGTDDGAVLMENVFIADHVLTEPITDPWQWPGVRPDTPLGSAYAATLRAISSTLPETYRVSLQEAGYGLESDALMMLPGATPELVELGFAMSAATPVAR